jgi:hypothetical protein
MRATAMAQLTMPLEFVVATALHLQMVLIAIYSMIPLMEQPNVLEVIPKMRLVFVGGIVTSMQTMIFFATTYTTEREEKILVWMITPTQLMIVPFVTVIIISKSMEFLVHREHLSRQREIFVMSPVPLDVTRAHQICTF